jgi:hypothetical protein
MISRLPKFPLHLECATDAYHYRGTVLAEVILFDPTNRDDLPSTSLAPDNLTYKRDNTSYANATTIASNSTNTTTISPYHLIPNRFSTSNSLLSVSYLYQSPTVTLQSTIINSCGEILTSLHSNYIGSFAIKDIWGEVRIIPPTTGNDDSTEQRNIVMGEVNGLGVYQGWGLGPRLNSTTGNQDDNNGDVDGDDSDSDSNDLNDPDYWWVQGAVYVDRKQNFTDTQEMNTSAKVDVNGTRIGLGMGTGMNGTMTVGDVEDLQCAGGIVIVGGWGDVKVSF